MEHHQFNLSQLNLTRNNKGKSGLELIDEKAFKSEKNWVKQEMKVPDFRNSGNSGSKAHPALTASTTDMWAFYQGKISSQSLPLIGRQFTPEEEQGADNNIWGPPIIMKMHDGTPIEHLGAVSARYFGPDQIIVVAGGYIGMSSDYPDPHKGSIFIGIFNLDDLNEKDNSWKAVSSEWLSVSSVMFYMEDLPTPLLGFDFGRNISIDWFLDLAIKDVDHPEYGLAINFSAGKSYTNFSPTIFLSLTAEEGTGKITGWDASAPKGKLRPNNSATGESGLMRDPAGRLRTYSYNSDKKVDQIQSRYYNTVAFPKPENKFESSGLEALPHYKFKGTEMSPEEAALLQSAIGYSELIDYKILPSGVFYNFQPGNTSPGDDMMDYPILEFTVYNRDKCQLNYYGSIRTVTATKKPIPKQHTNGPTIIIGGIIDGPIPFPLENYLGYELSAGTDEVGTLNYTKEKETEIEKSVESSWTAGFESEGKTSKGIGPAWKISVEAGMGSVLKKSAGSETDHELSVPATVISKRPFKDPEVDGIGTAKVLASEFIITACQFFDSSNKIINDGLSSDPSVGPKAVGILTTMLDSDESFSFETYTATPGNLESYTPEALNSRMKNRGYDGDDYFKEVIQANAFHFTKDVPFLVFKWNEGIVEGSGFKAFQSSFQEQKWTFDGSFYGGVSDGGGFEIFGMGEEFETAFLVGASYSRENSEATTNKTSWGVEIEGKENWGGPPVRNFEEVPESIKSYSFRLYFLPVPDKDSGLPPNYWTEELIQNVPEGDRIDPHSGSWRIMYVVTEIEYNDPKKKGYSIKKG
ncbi:MAG: hypothetical protein GYB31_19480 [Bacteroidetes bacterium]|nr:hypothetical protein [Bacteroidota bacterium]